MIMIAVGREYFPGNQAKLAGWLAGGKVLPPYDCGRSLTNVDPLNTRSGRARRRQVSCQ
ncbi:MAG: hypothetical protein LDL16_02770 [Thiobacillus sp.]|nr:hypothetical protein [Thiobacillus sp.]